MHIGSKILLSFTPSPLKKSIVYMCTSYLSNQPSTGYLTSLYGNHVTVKYPSKWLFPAKYMPFEGAYYPVPCNVDAYLRLSYGDYMKLPPKEKQVFHHNYSFIDFDTSYLKYKGEYYCRGN